MVHVLDVDGARPRHDHVDGALLRRPELPDRRLHFDVNARFASRIDAQLGDVELLQRVHRLPHLVAEHAHALLARHCDRQRRAPRGIRPHLRVHHRIPYLIILDGLDAVQPALAERGVHVEFRHDRPGRHAPDPNARRRHDPDAPHHDDVLRRMVTRPGDAKPRGVGTVDSDSNAAAARPKSNCEFAAAQGMERIAAMYGDGSDEEDQGCQGGGLGRLSLPPAHIVSGTRQAWSDRPDLHGNRSRSFPHVVGNYPTVVFVAVGPCPAFRSVCDRLNRCSLTRVPDEDRHMSLSKTATLRRHEIRAFVDELGKAVRDLRSFRVRFRRLILLVNEERSRTFVGASAVERDVGAVAKLIERVDMAMRAFGLPVYYADPKPHVTLAWCIGDQRQELSHVIGDDPLSLDADAAVVVDSVSAKIGNRLYTVYLKDQ